MKESCATVATCTRATSILVGISPASRSSDIRICAGNVQVTPQKGRKCGGDAPGMCEGFLLNKVTPGVAGG